MLQHSRRLAHTQFFPTYLNRQTSVSYCLRGVWTLVLSHYFPYRHRHPLTKIHSQRHTHTHSHTQFLLPSHNNTVTHSQRHTHTLFLLLIITLSPTHKGTRTHTQFLHPFHNNTVTQAHTHAQTHPFADIHNHTHSLVGACETPLTSSCVPLLYFICYYCHSWPEPYTVFVW
jgi:hypothetical protein